MIVRLSLLCAALLALPATCTAADISAVLNAEGGATVKASGDLAQYDTYQLSNLIAERRMVLKKPYGTISESNPGILGIEIADTFRPGAAIRVESFSYTAGGQEQGADRSERRDIFKMRLEASLDGLTGWTVLAEYDNPRTSPAEVDADVGMVRTVEVPVERQGDYRHYRFVVTSAGLGAEGQGTSFVAICKLVLYGSILNAATQVWNDGEDETWTAEGQSWSNADESVSKFIAGSRAQIGVANLTLDGTATIGGLDFNALSGPQTLSGGTLAFHSPATVTARFGARISSDIGPDSRVADTMASCVLGGERTPAWETFLPRSEANSETGAWVTYWKNRQLSQITGISAGQEKILCKDGGNYAPWATCFENDGLKASVQFQCKYGSNNALICTKVEFRQSGPDIEARAVYSKYWWTTIEPKDFDKIPSGSSCGPYKIYDENNKTGQGIKNILAISETGSLKIDKAHRQYETTGWFPPNPENTAVGKEVVYARNETIANLGGLRAFKPGRIQYASNGKVTSDAVAHPYFITASADGVTVQFQGSPSGASGALLCVKLQFRQVGNDVMVRAIWARFSRKHKEGDSFETGAEGSQPIFVSELAPNGYNLTDVYPATYTPIAFTGAFDPGVNLAVDDCELELGGEALSFDQPFIGTGRLLFTPAHGTQSVLFSGVSTLEGGTVLSGATVVTVSNAAAFAAAPVRIEDGAKLVIADGIAATIPEIVFAGDSTIEFGTGASLSVGAVDLTAAGSVSVASALGPTTLRIGESATLTKAELKKFWRFGKRFAQDESGYVFEYPAPGFILLFR